MNAPNKCWRRCLGEGILNSLNASWQSILIKTPSNFQIFRIFKPSRMSHNSSLKIKQQPKLLLYLRIQPLLQSFNTPPIMANPKFKFTTASVFRQTQLFVSMIDIPIGMLVGRVSRSPAPLRIQLGKEGYKFRGWWGGDGDKNYTHRGW